ncbi:MAG: phosphohydrolase [Clostridia bacterium]|nr:phosphohydrolase [Clostridia bacterium]
MADYIYTVSKKIFYPLNPKIEDIDICDIAHALSMLSRANGHFPFFHSVAQHSIECANEALARGLETKLCLACLLHDGAESYMSDVTTPVKNKLSDYREYEDKLIDLIFKKYVGELTEEEKKIVYSIDKDLLYYEFYHYMGIELSEKPHIFSKPVFEFKEFSVVRDEFLELFKRLKSER